jgi:hypothetical protein
VVGAFAEITYVLKHLSVQFLAEYGSWRVNIRYCDRPLFPASFWMAALRGSAIYPEPVVTEEDIDHLVSGIRQIVEDARSLAPTVEATGEAYRRAMRERLGER